MESREIVSRHPEVPQQKPDSLQSLLALHDCHLTYRSYQGFLPDLERLLQLGTLLDDCIALTQALGLLEPLTDNHIPPEAIQIQGSNHRESLVARGLLSRNRAVLKVLENTYGSTENLAQQQIYLAEAVSGFAHWLREEVKEEGLVCSEYLDDAEVAASGIAHQDLCALSFSNACFDLVLCNEVFEHVKDLDQAFREIARVLRPGGRLVATCPLAFGQYETIVKAQHNPQTGRGEPMGECEMHGDPIRPEHGSLVYRIPGWDVLEHLRASGFNDVAIHQVASWKHGVLGADLHGVLVIEAVR
jgi:SAM-dependent methyltransferase